MCLACDWPCAWLGGKAPDFLSAAPLLGGVVKGVVKGLERVGKGPKSAKCQSGARDPAKSKAGVMDYSFDFLPQPPTLPPLPVVGWGSNGPFV